MKEALVYEKLDNANVRCGLCNHFCVIHPDRRGLCGVRENKEGTLYSLVYGKLISSHVDPIEKKPFYHFTPGNSAFSIATVGCSFRCLFCQNWEISQFPIENPLDKIPGEDVSPILVVDSALKYKCKSIAYTYTEPTIFFEYAYDIAVLAKEKKLYNTFVTNGYMSPTALAKIAPILDGANVDLKSFSDDFYSKTCGAKLKPILTNIEKMAELGIWVEVTTLIIHELNDTKEELKKIASFLYKVSPDIPWHVSAFYPCYNMSKTPPTASHKIKLARDIGLDTGLRYVYSGNIHDSEGSTTFCYSCKKPLIERMGFNVTKNVIQNGSCPYCKTKINGKW